MGEYKPELIKKASYDPRFIYNRHFIVADVDKAFLDKYHIVAYVNDFKKMVRTKQPAFFAEVGNLNLYPNYRKIAVYDIYDFIPKENNQ